MVISTFLSSLLEEDELEDDELDEEVGLEEEGSIEDDADDPSSVVQPANNKAAARGKIRLSFLFFIEVFLSRYALFLYFLATCQQLIEYLTDFFAKIGNNTDMTHKSKEEKEKRRAFLLSSPFILFGEFQTARKGFSNLFAHRIIFMIQRRINDGVGLG